MGFGLLFFGYFCATLMSVNAFGSFIRIIGYSIVLIAAGKLSKYNRSFKLLSYTSVLMIAVSVLLASADVSSFLYEQLFIQIDILGGTYKQIVGYVEMALSFMFNASMLYAIKRISTETEVEKITFGAVRNFVFVCVYYVLCIMSFLPFEFAKYLGAPALIVYFAWIIFNLVLLASCYARICDESDVEMSVKPSRFAFVNTMRQKSEERKLKAKQSAEEYRKNKRKK